MYGRQNMSNTGLNTNRVFKEQVQINTEMLFYSITMVPIKKVLRKYYTCII